MFSSPKATRRMVALSTASAHGHIVDLGSGWGTLALAAARANPHKTVIGYELSPIPLYFSKLLKLLFAQRNLHFKRLDFFTLAFKADTLYLCYLYPGAMQRLQSKIENSAVKPELISNTFALPGYSEDKRVTLRDLYATPLYLYRKR